MMDFDKYGSDGHLFVPGVDETYVPHSIEESVEKIREALIQCFQPAIDAYVQIFRNLADTILPCCDLILLQYPDKRVVWLALHHKKERIRKKNKKRILKWIERNEKQDGRC